MIINELDADDIRFLKLAQEMTDSDRGYVLMPRHIAEELAFRKLVKITASSRYCEVQAVITDEGRSKLSWVGP